MIDPSVFLDATALGIVGGGTLLATALRGPFADTLAALHALRALGRRTFDAAPVRAELARIERIAGAKTLLATEDLPIRDRDVAQGVAAVIDGARPEQIDAMLDRLRDERRHRHAVVHGWWLAAAETAPAMGMVGTLFGLVGMFRSMDDPATIGAAMAIALLATLYGALFANLVAAPIAARLRRLSEIEDTGRRALDQPFRAFAARHSPPPSRSLAA